MRGIIKKVCCGVLLLALFGILIFPKQILVHCIAWKASSYCKQVFGAKLQMEASQWKKGEIVFQGGHLLKEGELDVVFETATLIPFLDWKKGVFGGKLHFEGLKIVHHKRELRPVPAPPPPSVKFLTLKLDTSVQNGEILLHDHLAHNHFFQHIKFELFHQVHGKETKGCISFGCNPDTPPFIAHFHGLDEEHLTLAVNLKHHPCSVLSHLISYFFHSYVPENILQWDILGGTIDGELHLALTQGVPQKIKGKLCLREFQTRNLPLATHTQFEKLDCDLDIDCACARDMQCNFDLIGGALESQRKLCQLENVEAQIHIQEGKIIHSFLKGNWMGFAAEMKLDWNTPELLMHACLSGSCDHLIPHLPQTIQKGFSEGFSADTFTLDAYLKKTISGLELAGELALNDEEHNLYNISFGGGSEHPSEHFFDLLKGNFCNGWFYAKSVPLDKFVSPFLLQNVSMKASGIADFKGTLNDEQLMIHYEGKDFCLESPYFRFELGRVCQYDTKVPMHHFDLKTKTHFGLLPMKHAKYYQKNYHFLLEEAAGDIHFENNKIHFSDITTTSEGLQFFGNVGFEVRSCEDVEMVIHLEKTQGSIQSAQRFLSHFKPSFFWEIPCDGEVLGEYQTAFFHYHFAPKAHLLSGYVQGELLSKHFKNLKTTIYFDCQSQALECCMTRDENRLLTLQAQTFYDEEGKKIIVDGNGPSQYETIHIEMVQKENEERSKLSFVCGPWSGNGVLDVCDQGIVLEHFNCWDGERRGFSFSGLYDQSKQVFKGNLHALKWDLDTWPWQGNGMISGTLEVYPNQAWVSLTFADGEYSIAGHKLNLDQFCLIYDPTNIHIKCRTFHHDHPFWLHLVTDSSTMDAGNLYISTSEINDRGTDIVKVDWEKRGLGWCIRSVAGGLNGLSLNLSDLGKKDFSNEIALEGQVTFHPEQMASLLSPPWQEKIAHYAIKGKYGLKGQFVIPKNQPTHLSFQGEMSGETCQVKGIEWSGCSSHLHYTPLQCKLTACSIKDAAGRLSINEFILNHAERTWDFELDQLQIRDMYLARLKGPWKQKDSFDKSFFRSLYVRSFTLDHCQGELADQNTISGYGMLEFSNIPKRTFLSNLLFLPSEITARIGLDLTALVPARGTITYNIQNSKVNFQEFKEMYSDGKYSRFYLAEGSPSYIDFQGNLNMKLKMKQYNLLMKLAELFTISVKGTLMHPSYTLINHVDDD